MKIVINQNDITETDDQRKDRLKFSSRLKGNTFKSGKEYTRKPKHKKTAMA